MNPTVTRINQTSSYSRERSLNGSKKTKRVESIDLLRGAVMIIMALDHVRDYFHRDAFLYSPTDLSQTSVSLFFTRFITHYCAPVFVFLAGMSAFLYGTKTSKKELSFFVLTRGVWLVLIELFIVSFFRTFNPQYTYVNLQVIWAIGISMIVLSGMIYFKRQLLFAIGFMLVAGHNVFDKIHVSDKGLSSFIWALFHEAKYFHFGEFTIYTHYPLIPWIGIMMLGYCCGGFYAPGLSTARRQQAFFLLGLSVILLFIFLRSGNWYGDANHWSSQEYGIFSFLSFLNVTKYPPSLLYTLATLGPALIFLSLSENNLSSIKQKIILFGRVAFFFYLAHILLIHVIAVLGAIISGSNWKAMLIIRTGVNKVPGLKGYGFDLITVYLVWIMVLVVLYPLCRRFDQYKRSNLPDKPWLSYL